MTDKSNKHDHLSREDIEHLAKEYGLDEEEIRELIKVHVDDRTQLEAVIASLRTG